MPTVLRLGPYRFFFYASDRKEPPHIHVERDRNKAKFWLKPVKFATGVGFSRSELIDHYRLISEIHKLLSKGWHDYFAN